MRELKLRMRAVLYGLILALGLVAIPLSIVSAAGTLETGVASRRGLSEVQLWKLVPEAKKRNSLTNFEQQP